ncbi:MAG: hypothetical protein V8R23_05955 [Alphaproteobacteria bacterium]
MLPYICNFQVAGIELLTVVGAGYRLKRVPFLAVGLDFGRAVNRCPIHRINGEDARVAFFVVIDGAGGSAGNDKVADKRRLAQRIGVFVGFGANLNRNFNRFGNFDIAFESCAGSAVKTSPTTIRRVRPPPAIITL